MDSLIRLLQGGRAGLFFLAGLDRRNGRDILTIHGAIGAFGEEHEFYVRSSLRAIAPEVELCIQRYSPEELHAAESLEAFARQFTHQTILADPTGAFARATQLLDLAHALRLDLNGSLSQLLWKGQSAQIVVVPRNPEAASSMESRVFELIRRHASPDLLRLIRDVKVGAPSLLSRHTPIDARSVPVRRRRVRRPVGSLLARLSGALALIGIGPVAAVASTNSEAEIEAPQMSPGIAPLNDLTTLGENSLGLRNPYQAIGGMRLYFGQLDAPSPAYEGVTPVETAAVQIAMPALAPPEAATGPVSVDNSGLVLAGDAGPALADHSGPAPADRSAPALADDAGSALADNAAQADTAADGAGTDEMSAEGVRLAHGWGMPERLNYGG